MRTSHSIWALLIVFSATSSANAEPLIVKSVRFTTSLELTATYDFYIDPLTGDEVSVGESMSRTKSSTTIPIHDSEVLAPFVEAAADADLFLVSAFTETGALNLTPRHGRASARSDILFSPMSDTTTRIGLDFVGRQFYTWSEALVRFYDVTAGTELWRFWWDMDEGMSGNVPWRRLGDRYEEVSLGVPTKLFASHSYHLSMYTATGSDGDGQGMTIRARVPEPSSLLMLGVGVLGVAWRRRALHRG